MQQIILNSVCVQFDRDKTALHRTEFNAPCDCQNCRNYYASIARNPAVVSFLESFGVDYQYAEEVFSWDLGQTEDLLIHHEGNYAVYGVLLEDVSIEQFELQISFKHDASFNHDREGDYFWIEVIGDFPYILPEPREIPAPSFFERVMNRIKAVLIND